MKYSVIVSINNTYALITNFIENLVSTTEFANGELIVIVDGCKDKDTLDYLEKLKYQFSFMKLIFSNEQVGYSVANNIAVKHSSGDILVFINSDVLPCKGSIEKLISFLIENETIGAVQGCLIYPQNNKIQSTGHLFMEHHNSHIYKGKQSNHPLILEQGSRQALTTAFCAMPKNIFYDNGGFNEKYFNAYDGMELTLKITQSGLKCIYYPKAVAYHITGATRNYIKFDNEMASKKFWSTWEGKIRIDIHDYIMPQITDKMRDQIYFVIDCGNLSDWYSVLQTIGINTSGVIKIQDRFEKSVNLYFNLPFEALHYNGPYLFLCNDNLILSGNYNWCVVRNNSMDLVIDSHGNVEFFQAIVGIDKK
jgi:GT2 family glycosyltransferase